MIIDNPVPIVVVVLYNVYPIKSLKAATYYVISPFFFSLLLSQTSLVMEHVCPIWSCRGACPVGGDLPRAIPGSRLTQHPLHVVSGANG